MRLPFEPAWSRRLRDRVGLRMPAALKRRTHPYPEQFSEDLDMPPPQGPTRLYLIATTPRCGSHFLGHAIQSCRHFGFPLEYINRMNFDLWAARFGSDDPETVFSNLIERRSSPTGWFGLKAHWNQLRDFSAPDVFDRRGGFSRVIWIYRRDLLGQAISRVVAEQTGQWISGAPARGDAAYDYARIVKNARYVRRQNEAWAAHFSAAAEKPLVVVFEELMADQPGVFAGIARYLDPKIDAALTPAPKTAKQSGATAAEWRRRFLSEMREEDAWVAAPQAF